MANEPMFGKDDAVRLRIREIANEGCRFGHRRLAILFKRDGKGMNPKKVYRLYSEERPTIREQGRRKRALDTRAPMAIQQEPNRRKSPDVISDALACIVDTSLSGRRVIREHGTIAECRELPYMVVNDAKPR